MGLFMLDDGKNLTFTEIKCSKSQEITHYVHFLRSNKHCKIQQHLLGY